MGNVMVSFVPLKKYCRESGISYRQIQLMIYRSLESGIVAAGAVKRVGGRWYAVPERMVAWINDQTAVWSSQQVRI